LLKGESGKNYVLLTAINYTHDMGTEIEIHLKLLSMYVNSKRNFIIPKIYYSKESPDNYIIDYVKCDKNTHSKLCEKKYCSFFGEFLRFCILECKLIPYDVESCVFENKLHLFDFGEFRPIIGKTEDELTEFKKSYEKKRVQEKNEKYDFVLEGLKGPLP